MSRPFKSSADLRDTVEDKTIKIISTVHKNRHHLSHLWKHYGRHEDIGARVVAVARGDQVIEHECQDLNGKLPVLISNIDNERKSRDDYADRNPFRKAQPIRGSEAA